MTKEEAQILKDKVEQLIEENDLLIWEIEALQLKLEGTYK